MNSGFRVSGFELKNPKYETRNTKLTNMIKSYIKVAWRNLVHNKTLAIIKLAGLSIGLSVCMLILLYTSDEFSYDRFHTNSPRIYRIAQEMQVGNNPLQQMQITPAAMGPAFKESIPEVQNFVRITGDAIIIKQNNEVFTESPLFADESFFSVFSFPLISGNAKTALQNDHSVVLSETAAKKFFGSLDIIGKTMQIKRHGDFENFTVTAVAKNSPENSSLKFGVLMPASYLKFDPQGGWIGGFLNTFLLLGPDANVAAVEKKMQELFIKNTHEQAEAFSKQSGMKVSARVFLQPFSDIHLSRRLGPVNGMSEGGNPRNSYVLSIIAVFVLLIACINFINLAIAQSLKRGKEIGVRKIMGGSPRQLVLQFLAESLLVSTISFAFAFVLTLIVLPGFNDLVNKKLSLSYLSDGSLYAGLLLLLVATSFISGFYPSLVLSRFQPIKVLYNRQKLLGKNYLTRGLVVLQFMLAIFLITGTFAMNKQVDFLLKADLGYDKSNVVSVLLPYGDASNKLAGLFKNELNGKRGISAVSARSGGVSMTMIKTGGEPFTIRQDKIDSNYLSLLKIPLIAGRNFSSLFPSDSAHAVIVNESFVQAAGWKAEAAVGKTFRYTEEGRNEMTIVGVVKNYHFSSMREKIEPQVFTMNPFMNYGEIYVKVNPANTPQALATIRNTFSSLVPFFPIEYKFLEDAYAEHYDTDLKGKQAVGIASVIFIIISCMGLLGLVMLSVEQRTKEIGIRKVLGAAVSNIILLISKQFLFLILISFVMAIPLAYYVIGQWLQDFAYRTSMSWWVYALPGLIAIAIAMLTLCFQSIRAALANPVKCLRTE
jgi:putative ABC transport system permease protein